MPVGHHGADGGGHNDEDNYGADLPACHSGPLVQRRQPRAPTSGLARANHEPCLVTGWGCGERPTLRRLRPPPTRRPCCSDPSSIANGTDRRDVSLTTIPPDRPDPQLSKSVQVPAIAGGNNRLHVGRNGSGRSALPVRTLDMKRLPPSSRAVWVTKMQNKHLEGCGSDIKSDKSAGYPCPARW